VQANYTCRATVVVLYRPYILHGHTALPAEAQTLWQKTVLDRARAAASNSNNVLEKIIELNAVHLLKPMMITTLIPAMQIHLFDCKSTVPLRRGLGSNKLNLCMLILSKLRETYWSAGVIYRLFERAQLILGSSNPNVSNNAEKTTTSLPRPGFHSSSQGVADTEHHLQQNHQQEQQRQQQQQQAEEEEEMVPMLQIPEHTALMSEQVTPSWLSESTYFSTIDQLLSPGFSISEYAFQSLIPGYDNDVGGVYDQIVPVSSEAQMSLLHNV